VRLRNQLEDPRQRRLDEQFLERGAQALAHRTGAEPSELEPLPDELEARAHEVSAKRARSRGGKSG